MLIRIYPLWERELDAVQFQTALGDWLSVTSRERHGATQDIYDVRADAGESIFATRDHREYIDTSVDISVESLWWCQSDQWEIAIPDDPRFVGTNPREVHFGPVGAAKGKEIAVIDRGIALNLDVVDAQPLMVVASNLPYALNLLFDRDQIAHLCGQSTLSKICRQC